MRVKFIVPFVLVLLTACVPEGDEASSATVSGIQSDGDTLIKLSINKSLVGYFTSLLSGDVDSAITYVHPLVFRRMQAIYPSGTDVKAELKKSMTDDGLAPY